MTHQLTDALTLALNADYGDERLLSGLVTWKGVALYGRYAIGEQSAVALRAEILDDPAGYATGLGLSRLDVKEATGTFEHTFADALILRCEARYDFSNDRVFDKKTDINHQQGQSTLLIGLVALF